MKKNDVEVLLNDTERILLDVINEIQFTPKEKYELIESYVPALIDFDDTRYKTRFLRVMEFFINRIEFVEILREYAESRRRGMTVKNYMP